MKKAKIKVILAALFMLAILAVGLFPAAHFVTSYAAESTYSSVMDDLQKDSAFRSADYPANKKDTSLQVIQIAESTADELFVYTYQPCASSKKLSATSISISTTINEKYAPRLYTLKELSSEGVFGKYVVNGFKVQSGSERYYDIPEIFRAFDSKIDKPIEDASTSGTTVSEVSFAVGKLYTARTGKLGAITYECTATETIEIINPAHGSLRYTEGLVPSILGYTKGACDSWFVAFNTDKRIDRLMEATVYYVATKYTTTLSVPYSPILTRPTIYDEPQELYAEPTDKDKASTNPHLWLEGKPREWDRIQSTQDFISSEKLNSDMEETVSGLDWVLRFTETDYEDIMTTIPGYIIKVTNGTEISDVSILRLKFETDGVVYNLGAVDNKYTPDTNPDNKDQNVFDWSTLFPKNPSSGGSWWDWLVKAWKAIVAFFTGHSD